MALAELWFGKGKGCKDFIVANLGCGIVVEGMILLGSNGKSGEIGHTIIDVNTVGNPPALPGTPTV
jgi:glucokinase